MALVLWDKWTLKKISSPARVRILAIIHQDHGPLQTLIPAISPFDSRYRQIFYFRIMLTYCLFNPFGWDPVLKDWSLTEIQNYVVKALFLRYFKVLQPIKFILNIHKIIRGYSWCGKLKYYELLGLPCFMCKRYRFVICNKCLQNWPSVYINFTT